MFDEMNIVEVVDGGVRYCLCKNPLMAEKETKTRNELLAKTAGELDKIISAARKTKYSKEVRVGKILNKYSMGKFVKLSGSGDDLSYTFDQEKIQKEQLLDGCYIVYTDVDPAIMTAVETVKNYKSLIQVEQAFRSLKTVRLEVRPIFHKRDDRIKCHVFICMLAYYVLWHMKQRLVPLFESDGNGVFVN
jgi:transposase